MDEKWRIKSPHSGRSVCFGAHQLRFRWLSRKTDCQLAKTWRSSHRRVSRNWRHCATAFKMDLLKLGTRIERRQDLPEEAFLKTEEIKKAVGYLNLQIVALSLCGYILITQTQGAKRWKCLPRHSLSFPRKDTRLGTKLPRRNLRQSFVISDLCIKNHEVKRRKTSSTVATITCHCSTVIPMYLSSKSHTLESTIYLQMPILRTTTTEDGCLLNRA